MARRKSKFIEDDDYSSSDDDDRNNSQDELNTKGLLNEDELQEQQLFRNPYSRGKKRSREDAKEDATYGIWAQEEDQERERSSTLARGRGGKKDYLKGQSFVAASGSNSSSKPPVPPVDIDNLSTSVNLSIEPAREDEEDLAMEMGTSDEDEEEPAEAMEEEEEDEEDLPPVTAAAEEEEDLVPIPGLNTSTTTTAQLEEESAPGEDSKASSLSFAPRGVGAGIGSRGRGRGGIGSTGGRGGGVGGFGSISRGGIGSNSSKGGIGSGSTTTTPMFAAATSMSTNPVPVPHTSSTESPLGPSSRAGIGSSTSTSSKPSNSLIDSLRAELAGGTQSTSSPSTTTTTTNSSSTTTATNTPRIGSPAPPPSTSFPPPASLSSATTSTTPSTSTAAPPRRSFLPSAPPAPSTTTKKPAVPLSKTEQRHFASLRTSNSIGLKMLEKMGWNASSGTGLGREGQGIVTPIGEGQKLRRKGEGIKTGERSKVSWEEEARRKGVSVKELQGLKEEEEDDEEEKKRRLREGKKEERKAQWSTSGGGAGTGGRGGMVKKEKKPKMEYKTYDEIVAESQAAGGEYYEQKELLVDLSGNALPDQTISSSLPAFGAASADPTRLPELRHNLTLLTSTLSSSLRALAKDGASVIERRKYLLSEENRVKVHVERQEDQIERLKGIMKVVERVREGENEVKDMLSMLEEGEMCGLLSKFEDDFDTLLGHFEREYVEMRLDEVVIGAITPICRRIFLTWDPLSNPTLAVSNFKRYRKHFLIDKHASPSSNSTTGNGTVDVYGNGGGTSMSSSTSRKNESERVMSAYESFMWTIWLPKIRSAINNEWTPSNPSPAVTLFSTWSPLLPTFLRDNILDQLIIPKLSAAVAEWSASAYRRGNSVGLHTIVFPWLEVAGEDRMEGLLDECKRKVRAWVKSGWKAKEGVPQGLEVWKDAFSKSDWDTLVLQHVLPSLGTLLRDKFTINPRSQDLAPIDAVLAWKPLLRSSMLSQLIEAEFFPKWGDALWVWLKSEGVNLEQVAEWYSWWKSYFPEDVVALSGVSRGFRKGLDLMNQAMALGEDVQYRLKKPDFQPKRSSSSSSSPSSRKPKSTIPPPTTSASTSLSTEISFRSIVEELCSNANLLFLSTGRTTPRGQNLFRVSESIEKARGGVLVYLEDDVVWIVDGKKEGGEAEPVSVDEMIRLAQAASK